MIVTRRLKLVPATVELLRAEIGDHVEFARLLSASIPDNWPPESTLDALPVFLECVAAAPNEIGWFGWYALTITTEPIESGGLTNQTQAVEPATLIGGGGFMGPPRDGTVQIGYSVIDQYQRKGYATEMVHALINWARSKSGGLRVIAETEWSNPASARVLTKTGFVSVGPASTAGGMRFELGSRK